MFCCVIIVYSKYVDEGSLFEVHFNPSTTKKLVTRDKVAVG